MVSRRERIIYLATIIGKGLFAVGECVSGLVLYFATDESIRAFNRWILKSRVFAESADVRLDFFRHLLENMQLDAKTFVAVYLILHGLLKVAIVLGLLSGHRRAYPLALVGLGLFVLYQLYHYAMHGNVIIVVLAALDVFIMLLVWREWGDATGPNAPQPPAASAQT
jgi:uncharacterized membrane protein